MATFSHPAPTHTLGVRALRRSLVAAATSTLALSLLATVHAEPIADDGTGNAGSAETSAPADRQGLSERTLQRLAELPPGDVVLMKNGGAWVGSVTTATDDRVDIRLPDGSEARLPAQAVEQVVFAAQREDYAARTGPASDGAMNDGEDAAASTASSAPDDTPTVDTATVQPAEESADSRDGASRTHARSASGESRRPAENLGQLEVSSASGLRLMLRIETGSSVASVHSWADPFYPSLSYDPFYDGYGYMGPGWGSHSSVIATRELRPLCTTPCNTEVPRGGHSLTVTEANGRHPDRSFELRRPLLVDDITSVELYRHSRRPARAALISSGAAAFVAGVVMAAVAGNDNDNLESAGWGLISVGIGLPIGAAFLRDQYDYREVAAQ